MGAYEYAKLIARLLETCEYLDPRPAAPSKIVIPKDNERSFFWKEIFPFTDEKVLTIKDMATFDPDGRMLERNFAYDFRDKGSSDPIFRICNHGVWQSVSERCHVHVGEENNTIECFPSSEKTDFSYVIHCIKNFYLAKRQDWEKGGTDAPDI